jgi:hypothetical protein
MGVGNYGVPSISGSGGTLFYNNASDFTGSCDVECFFVSASATFNFLYTGTGNIFATYAGGGVPVLGYFNGNGTWSG